MGNQLTWALVVPTYNRRDILQTALRHAAEQTRKPMEIIVVDSSPDASKTKELLRATVVREFPNIRWEYLLSNVRSAAIQRNEGIRLCSADIVFFIDDDCFMYPQYAEVIMNTYEADRNRELRAVCGLVTDVLPLPLGTPTVKPPRPPLWRRAVRRLAYHLNHYALMNTSQAHFYPYYRGYPDRPLPALDVPYRVYPVRLFGGGSATFPIHVLRDLQFDNDLLYYSVAEDLDLAYRVSQSGPMAMVFDALIHHGHHQSIRPDLYTISLMAITNHAFFIQKNNPSSVPTKIGYLFRVAKRLIGEFIFDTSEGRFSYPRLRGTLSAIIPVIRLFTTDPSSLSAWYRQFQKCVYERGASREKPRESRTPG